AANAAGERRKVACRYRLLDATRFGFQVDSIAAEETVIVDPVLTFAGYLSGSAGEEAHGVAVDSSGALYVTGRTGSANFPKTPGAFDVTLNGAYEAFVSKINPAGT